MSSRRPKFDHLPAAHPSERLRLETDSDDSMARVLDLFVPVGKGQRILMSDAPRAAAHALTRTLARSLTTNNPECHLMYVSIDSRPEDVSDVSDWFKGEVIATLFDDSEALHAQTAGLALERAKRLVELGHDVVLILDSVTRIAEALMQSSMKGETEVEPNYVAHSIKGYFGSGRQIRDGGSLTLVALAGRDPGRTTGPDLWLTLEKVANAIVVLTDEELPVGVAPIDALKSRTMGEERLASPAELLAAREHRLSMKADGQSLVLADLARKIFTTESNSEMLSGSHTTLE